MGKDFICYFRVVVYGIINGVEVVKEREWRVREHLPLRRWKTVQILPSSVSHVVVFVFAILSVSVKGLKERRFTKPHLTASLHLRRDRTHWKESSAANITRRSSRSDKGSNGTRVSKVSISLVVSFLLLSFE